MLAGHHDVEDHGGRALGVIALDRLFGVAHRDGVIAALGEERFGGSVHIAGSSSTTITWGFTVEIACSTRIAVEQCRCQSGKIVVDWGKRRESGGSVVGEW